MSEHKKLYDEVFELIEKHVLALVLLLHFFSLEKYLHLEPVIYSMKSLKLT